MIAIAPTTKFEPGMPIPPQFPGQFRFQRGPATLTDLPQIPDAGEPLSTPSSPSSPARSPSSPTCPKRTYYALTLDRRDPVSYMALMGPNGSLATYWSETQMEVMRKSYAEGMARLREAGRLQARGLPVRGEGPAIRTGPADVP